MKGLEARRRVAWSGLFAVTVMAFLVAEAAESEEEPTYHAPEVKIDHVRFQQESVTLIAAIEELPDESTQAATLVAVGPIQHGDVNVVESGSEVPEGTTLEYGVLQYEASHPDASADVILSDGRIVSLEDQQTVYVGSEETLVVTHECICECTCNEQTIAVDCSDAPKSKECDTLEGETCETWEEDEDGNPVLVEGTISDCERKYVPPVNSAP